MIQPGFARKWISLFPMRNRGTKWILLFRSTNCIHRSPRTRPDPRDALGIERMNKTHLLKSIIARLTKSLEVLDKAARTSHAEATHESSKAENKYDTRGLEAAYLAGGQAKQAREILDSIQAYESLVLKSFA